MTPRRRGRFSAGRVAWVAAAMAMLVLGSGCRTSDGLADLSAGPHFTPSNVVSAPALPAGFQRVAVLPFYYEGREGQWLEDLETIFHGELVGTGRFEVIPVNRALLEEWTGRMTYASFEALSPALFESLQREYAVDGILFTDLSRYSPYRPLGIGVRSKLVTSDGSIVWAIDELFDAGQGDVARGARAFYLGHIRQAYPLDSSRSILQSPGRFGKYAAHTIYQTLPPHQAQRVPLSSPHSPFLTPSP